MDEKVAVDTLGTGRQQCLIAERDSNVADGVRKVWMQSSHGAWISFAPDSSSPEDFSPYCCVNTTQRLFYVHQIIQCKYCAM